jgi:hypothetical protein
MQAKSPRSQALALLNELHIDQQVAILKKVLAAERNGICSERGVQAGLLQLAKEWYDKKDKPVKRPPTTSKTASAISHHKTDRMPTKMEIAAIKNGFNTASEYRNYQLAKAAEKHRLQKKQPFEARRAIRNYRDLIKNCYDAANPTTHQRGRLDAMKEWEESSL